MRGRKGDAADFWSKVDVGDWWDCWPWTDSTATDGYGRFYPSRGVNLLAHRHAYELLVGPTPSGLVLDHVRAWGCTSRSCCNPLHLEPVTIGENVRRGGNAIKTHCPRDHEYTPENTMSHGGSRTCRTCHREQGARRRRAKQGVG